MLSPAVHSASIKQRKIKETPFYGSIKIEHEKAKKIDWKREITRYYIVFGSVLIQLTLGTIFGFGNILPYLASYMASRNIDQNKVYSDEELTDAYKSYLSQCNWIFSSSVIAVSLGCILGGWLEVKFGCRIATLIGCLMVTIGCGMNYLVADNIYLCFVFFGIIFGCGNGIAYGVPIVVCMRWFPESQGKVTGIVLAAFGGGPFLFNIIQTRYINPNNKPLSTDYGYLKTSEVLDRTTGMFLFTAVIFLVFQFIGVIGMTNPPEYKEELEEVKKYEILTQTQKLKRQQEREKNNVSEIDNEQDLKDFYTTSQVCGLVSFWGLELIAFTNLIAFLFIPQCWKVFAVEYIEITNDHFLSTTGSVAALFSGFGRTFWGFVYDFFSNRENKHIQDVRYYNVNKALNYSMAGMAGMQAAFILTICFVPKYIHIYTTSGNDVGKEILFFIWICCIFFCNGGFYAFFPSVLTTYFGERYAATFIGFILLSETPATIIDSLIFNFIKYITWDVAMIALGICAGMSCILGFIYKSKPAIITLNPNSKLLKYQTKPIMKPDFQQPLMMENVDYKNYQSINV